MKTIYPLLLLSFLGFTACKSIPEGAKAVEPFKLDNYLGQWYEIARLDFKFEENLNNTTAEYSLRDDGKVKVLNQGYNYVKKEWDSAVGKATFRGNENVGELKVSFFGPFYAPYNVIDIEGDYQYALVVGKNTSYMWILSRTTSLPETVKESFLAKAKEIGVNIDELVWVEHNRTRE